MSCRAANGRSHDERASRTAGSRSRGSARPMPTFGRRSGQRPRSAARMGRARIGRRGRGRHPDGSAGGPGQTRPARARRPGPAQPGCHAGDSPGAGGRRGHIQVRPDRDRGDRPRRVADRPCRRRRPAARDPPPRRVSAPCRQFLARRGPARLGGGRPVAWRIAGLRHARCRGRLPGPAARRAGARARALRPRDPRPARGCPGGPAPASSRDRARTCPRRALGLAGGERPPRPRSRRAARSSSTPG